MGVTTLVAWPEKELPDTAHATPGLKLSFFLFVIKMLKSLICLPVLPIVRIVGFISLPRVSVFCETVPFKIWTQVAESTSMTITVNP